MSQDQELPDGDYTLKDGSAWFTVGKASVKVQKTDEGVVADIYPLGKEDGEALASAYVFDTELDEAATET